MKRKIIAAILAVLMLVSSGCSQGVGSNVLSENGADGGAAQEEAIVSVERKEFPFYFVVMSQEKTLPLYFINGDEIPYVSIEDWATVMEDLAEVYSVSESSEGVKYSMDVETDGDILTLRREDGYTMKIDFNEDTFTFWDYNAFLRWGGETLLDLNGNNSYLDEDGTANYLKRSKYNNERYGREIVMSFSDYDIDLIRDENGYYAPLQTMSDILLCTETLECSVQWGGRLYHSCGKHGQPC